MTRGNKPIKKAIRSALRLVDKSSKKRTSSTHLYSSDRPGIDPIRWCERAGLKPGWREIDLQHYIATRLKASGYILRENVTIDLEGGGWCEADIIIYQDGQPWQILEVKPYLDRSKVIEGTNQARSYSELLKCSQQPILIGLAPYADRPYWGGRNAIKTTAHTKVGVVYLNEHPDWCEPVGGSWETVSIWDKLANKLTLGWDRLSWKIKAPLSLVFILWIVLGSWEFSSRIFHPSPIEEDKTPKDELSRVYMKTKIIEIEPAPRAIASWSEEGQKLRLARHVSQGDQWIEVYEEGQEPFDLANSTDG